jgi:hypothetical protein
MAFFQTKLFAATTVGVLEVESEKVRTRHPSDGKRRMEGPWVDHASNAMFVSYPLPERVMRLDKSGDWRAVDLPTPSSGNYSRQDVLKGFRCVETPTGITYVGGGQAWRWDDPGAKWVPEKAPSRDYGKVVDLATFMGRRYLAISKGFKFSITPDDSTQEGPVVSIYTKDENRWRKLPNKAGEWLDRIDRMVSADDLALILLTDGSLLRLTADEVSRLDSPGVCETLVRTSGGQILASFLNKGVYAFAGGWELKLPCPYASDVGSHDCSLAEAGGTVALSISSDAPSPPGNGAGGKIAPTRIWVSKGTAWKPVNLGYE